MADAYADMNSDILKKILYEAPAEIRPMLLQEFYINPLESLNMFYECKTYDDVKMYRNERAKRERSGVPSSFNNEGELTYKTGKLKNYGDGYAC